MHRIALMSQEQAADLLVRTRDLEWVDGRGTARGPAAEVKSNEQARKHGPAYDEIAELVRRLIDSDARVRDAAFARRMTRPLVNRYGVGGRYGMHVDAATRGGLDAPVRTDVSYTLFLTPPQEYEGGELQVATDSGVVTAKEPAGTIVLYPTHFLHQVTPVTAGERVAVVGWLESWIADPTYRALMAKVRQVQRAMEGDGASALSRTLMSEVAEGLLRHGSR